MREKLFMKRIIALVTAALMIVTMLPVSALAAEAPAADVMIEGYAEEVTAADEVTNAEVIQEAEAPEVTETYEPAQAEEAADVTDEGDLVAQEEILFAKAVGTLSDTTMYFKAELTGVTVEAAVPVKRAPKGSYMTAEIVDVSAFAEAAAAKYYGKAASDLCGVELHFYKKNGKAINSISKSTVTLTLEGVEAPLYTIGRVSGDTVVGSKKATVPTFTVTASYAYTYVLASLVGDGVPRSVSKAKSGKHSFKLDDGDVNIAVTTPKGAFSGTVAMEASDVTAELEQDDGVDDVDGTIVGAYDISFYNNSTGAELQPEKEVNVTIKKHLDMTKNHVLVHRADDGSSSIVENAQFTESEVTFSTDGFSIYEIREVEAPKTLGAVSPTITFNVSTQNLRAEGPKIAASKTVLDTDGDGIYELALNVTGQSEQSTTAEVQKQNVVLVIDVSGSMNEIFERHKYTYSSSTYNQHSAYYAQWSNGEYATVTYGSGLQGTGWYTTGLIPIRVDHFLSSWLFSSTDIYYGETRLDATKSAAGAVVDALLAYNTNDDNITDMFEISVVKFANKTAVAATNQHGYYNGTETIISKSTNATAIKNAINGLEAGGGTNWEAALQKAKAEADEITPADEKTSVIFLTDGFPTFYGNDQGGGSESNSSVSSSYSNARDDARAIVSAGYTLYNIFAFGSDTTMFNGHTGYQYMCALTNYAYGTGNSDNFSTTTDDVKNYCFNAKSPQSLIDSFSTIVAHITNNVGYAGVSISDGVSLGATSTSVAVNGQAKPESMRYTVKDDTNKTVFKMTIDKDNKATFVIYNADGTETTLVDTAPEERTTEINGEEKKTDVYSVTVGSGEEAKTYEMSPSTIDENTGMVKWDLSGLGILENGYTYTVAFDVWPNQLAYDIAADLNNGIYADVDAALTVYGVTDTTERNHIKEALHKNDDGSYSLYTNYEQKVEFYPATSTTDDEGNQTWDYGTKQDQSLDKPKPIALQGSLLPLRKDWESELSIEEYNELLWVDGNVGGTSNRYGVTLYVWKAESEAALMTMANTGVTDDNKPYITAKLGWDNDKNDYIWEKDVAVAPGTMVNVAEAKALGYDPDNDPGNVRTFTNNQGVPIEYYVIEQGHYYYVTEEEIDLHFELNTVLYHPMIVDGTLYNVGFGSGQTVETMDPMYAVVATNRLKGGLNINKVVSTTQIAVADGEIKSVTEPKDADGVKTNTFEFLYEINIWKEDAEGHKSAVYTYDDQIDTANNEAIGGSIGYRIFSEPKKDGDEITYENTVRGAILPETSPYKELAKGNYAIIEDNVTTLALSMPANGEIRLVNLPANTKYSVKEVVDTPEVNYHYAATLSQVKKHTGLTEGTVTTANTVEGTIKGNTAAVETYYNWGANFFVYHSSDKTIEKISFADSRVKGEYVAENEGYTYRFNIADETKTDTNGKPYLYGGYYKGYSGRKLTNAEITGAEYAADLNEKYWITDTEGTAYDAKKANVWVKDEAFTDEKDTKTGEGGKGTEMTPIVNGVYFLKEVPNGYIRPYLHYTYHQYEENQPLKALYLITATDDKNYNSVGFIIKPANETKTAPTGSTLITIKNPDQTINAKLTVKSIYTQDQMKKYAPEPMGELTRGYLYRYDASSYIGSDEIIYQPCWETLDKVSVEGLTVRTVGTPVNAPGNDNAISATDAAAE